MRLPRLAIILLATLGATFARTSAQAASYTFFGQECSLAGVEFVVPNPPRLGQTFMVVSGPSCKGACFDTSIDHFVVTGASNTTFHGLLLPIDLARMGLRACGLLHVSVLHVAITRNRGTEYRGDVVYPIANDPSLLGVSFYQQVVRLECSFMFGCSADLGRGGHGVIGR